MLYLIHMLVPDTLDMLDDGFALDNGFHSHHGNHGDQQQLFVEENIVDQVCLYLKRVDLFRIKNICVNLTLNGLKYCVMNAN